MCNLSAIRDEEFGVATGNEHGGDWMSQEHKNGHSEITVPEHHRLSSAKTQ